MIDFYVKHHSGQTISDMCWVLAFSCFLIFVGALRERLRQDPRAAAHSATMLAGASVVTAGAALYFGCDWVLARAPATLTPSAAQALNQLALGLFQPISAGAIVFGLSAGIAILRSAVLPKPLGVVALVIAVVSVTGFGAIILTILWTAAASVILYRRRPTARPRATADQVAL